MWIVENGGSEHRATPLVWFLFWSAVCVSLAQDLFPVSIFLSWQQRLIFIFLPEVSPPRLQPLFWWHGEEEAQGLGKTLGTWDKAP